MSTDKASFSPWKWRALCAACLLLLLLLMAALLLAAARKANPSFLYPACTVCHGQDFSKEPISSLRHWKRATPLTPLIRQRLQDVHPWLPEQDRNELARHLAMRQLPVLLASSQTDRADMLYRSKCAVCHGDDGKGQPGQYPPLLHSEWLTDTPSRLDEILVSGLDGPISVRDEQWDSTMLPPGVTQEEDRKLLMDYLRKRFAR